MKRKAFSLGYTVRRLMAITCVVGLAPGDAPLFALQTQPSSSPAAEESVRLPPEQIDSLVAPIALYPDPLLSQTLVASTYPLEIIQLQQWLDKNKDLKDQALADAVKKQNWDPSVQALALLPDVAKRLSENIKWTTDLGNAFLAQQNDVMDAVQRMRKKAQDTGNLKSSEQQKVETKVIESKPTIIIEQANPQVVYVPSYNPTVVYGAPAYPYPPVYYPPPGYYAAGMAISFGVGMMMGAAWGGGWGYGCGWGGNNNVYINNNNNFVKNSNVNRQNVNRQNVSNRGGTSNWQHNPQHRGGAPYGDRNTARQFGGTTRGDTLANRQADARRNQAERGDRDRAGNNDRRAGTGRPEQAALRDQGGSSGRQQGGGAGARDAGNPGSGDRVGNRSVSNGGGSRNSSAFGGGGGFSGSGARASSSRGSSSMGSRGSRGGGGRRR